MTTGEKDWFYQDGDQKVGPFDLEQLVKLNESGIISAETLVGRPSEDQWFHYQSLVGSDGRIADKTWYYKDGPDSVGPFDPFGLLKMYEKGVISEDSLIQHVKGSQWVLFKEHFGLYRSQSENSAPNSIAGSQPPDSVQDPWTGEARTASTSQPIGEPVSSALPVRDPNVATSEIQSDGEPDASLPTGWVMGHRVPWRRYGARLLDISVNGMIGIVPIATAWYAVAPSSADAFFNDLNPLLDVVLTSLLGCFISGIFIGFSGSSLGKWIFGVQVLGQNMKPIGVAQGIQRDIEIWFKGLGCGIPLISLFTLVSAYNRLKEKGITSWDEGSGYLVVHRESTKLQSLMNVVGVLLIIVVQFSIRLLGES